MPYFAIKEKGMKEVVCVCQEESIDSVISEQVLGPGEWIVRQITEEEAEKWAEEWANGELNEEDICPICEGPRARCPRGEILVRKCKACDFES